MKIEITKIKILIYANHPDTVWLKTTLPNGMYPFSNDDRLDVKFDVTSGTGVDYVRKHFDIEPEVIDVPSLQLKRIKGMKNAD